MANDNELDPKDVEWALAAPTRVEVMGGFNAVNDVLIELVTANIARANGESDVEREALSRAVRGLRSINTLARDLTVHPENRADGKSATANEETDNG